MADVEQPGLDSSGGEQSLYSGELTAQSSEQPEGNGGQSSEQPITEGAGESVSESEDSELGNLYADLEKDIPEALKPHATNVKKKVQAYLTKKTQGFSQKLSELEKNQLTEDLKRDYTTLYGWYEKLQRNPSEGLRELASQLGISVKALVEATEAQQPKAEGLTLQYVIANPTAENWAAFNRQESQRLLEEFRDKEVKPLKETLYGLKGGSEKRENIERGAKVIEEAKSLPGFADKTGNLTKEANEAIALVLKKEFQGPNALKNAFFAVVGRISQNKVKELETNLLTLKKNVRGVSNPPDGHSPKTVTPPSSPEGLWDDLLSEPLTP